MCVSNFVHFQQSSAKKFLWSENVNPDRKLFKFPFAAHMVMLKVSCGVVRDGKHIQPFTKY